MQDVVLENNDLSFSNGDFAIRDSLLQESKLILVSNIGDWRQWPAIGVDVENNLLDDQPIYKFKQLYTQHLKYDNKKLTKFEYQNNEIKINVENS